MLKHLGNLIHLQLTVDKEAEVQKGFRAYLDHCRGNPVRRWVLARLAGSVCNLLDSPTQELGESPSEHVVDSPAFNAHCSAHRFGPGVLQQVSAGSFQIF